MKLEYISGKGRVESSVLGKYPLRQGLKLEYISGKDRVESSVLGKYPLRQGLKPPVNRNI